MIKHYSIEIEVITISEDIVNILLDNSIKINSIQRSPNNNYDITIEGSVSNLLIILKIIMGEDISYIERFGIRIN